MNCDFCPKTLILTKKTLLMESFGVKLTRCRKTHQRGSNLEDWEASFKRFSYYGTKNKIFLSNY